MITNPTTLVLRVKSENSVSQEENILFPFCASVRSWLSKQTLLSSVFKYANLTIFLLGPLGFLKFAKTLYSTEVNKRSLGRTMGLAQECC